VTTTPPAFAPHTSGYILPTLPPPRWFQHRKDVNAETWAHWLDVAIPFLRRIEPAKLDSRTPVPHLMRDPAAADAIREVMQDEILLWIACAWAARAAFKALPVRPPHLRWVVFGEPIEEFPTPQSDTLAIEVFQMAGRQLECARRGLFPEPVPNLGFDRLGLLLALHVDIWGRARGHGPVSMRTVTKSITQKFTERMDWWILHATKPLPPDPGPRRCVTCDTHPCGCEPVADDLYACFFCAAPPSQCSRERLDETAPVCCGMCEIVWGHERYKPATTGDATTIPGDRTDD
jgi:hypothetical protein